MNKNKNSVSVPIVLSLVAAANIACHFFRLGKNYSNELYESIHPFFPSSENIINAVSNPFHARYALSVAFLLAVVGAISIYATGARVRESPILSRRQLAIAGLVLIPTVAGFGLLILFGNYHPGTAQGRGSSLFRSLSQSDFGITLIACFVSASLAFIFWIVPYMSLSVIKQLLINKEI